MNDVARKNEVFRMLERERPEAIIGETEYNGFIIPLVDPYNHPGVLELIDAQAKGGYGRP